MADWLVYWQTYWAKISDPKQVTPNWNSSSESLYEKVQPGDVIWVVVAGGAGHETEWRLLERFTVQTKRINDSAEEYGWRYVGDDASHEVFDPMAPNDLTPILTSLDFASSHPIRFSGRQIGQAIQGPRELAAHDAAVLDICAKILPHIKRGVAGAG